MFNIEVLRYGEAITLHALVVNNKCLIRDFINDLEDSDKKQVVSLLQQRADRLDIHNQQHFRSLGNEIFELKTRGGIRILCFWDGERKLVLTHGFLKPHQKVLNQEKKKAIRWLKEFRDKRR